MKYGAAPSVRLLVQALDEAAVIERLQDARIGEGGGLGAFGFGIVLAEAFQQPTRQNTPNGLTINTPISTSTGSPTRH
jgi:hypothetical protein